MTFAHDHHELEPALGRLIGRCRQVHTEVLPSCPDLFDVARAGSREPGCVFLASGGEVDSARYHILAVSPWLTLTVRAGTWTCAHETDRVQGTGSPWPILARIVDENRVHPRPECGPVCAGLFGYLGYELAGSIEDLPRTCLDDMNLPDLYLIAPGVILVQEPGTRRTWLHLCVWDHPQAPGEEELRKRLSTYLDRAEYAERRSNPPAAGTAVSSLSEHQYLQAVHTIQDYIRAGDVYQVNLSQRLRMPFSGHPFTLFETLFGMNPAPFYAYIQAGDHQVVSTSPERFLAVRGDKVETRPIKGTRPKGHDSAEDAALARELQESSKDGAELAMIVDLMRNDLGKVCRTGSVQVREHKRLEAYANVFHLVSVISGSLEPEQDLVGVIRAAFPGGSITGCPKIRAMQIIDELEPFKRHVYTGSIGYLGFDGQMDLSIAIRTAVIAKGRLVYSVGGGVVIDSQADEEYEETWHKGRTFAQVLHAHPAEEKPMGWVWLDGHVVAEREAVCPVRSPAVEYGFGVFETLRADGGRPWFLPEHIARMESAWRQLAGRSLPDLDWEEVVAQVLLANRLEDDVAAVKIYSGWNGERQSVCVSARHYRHRLADRTRDRLRLAVHPEPRQSFLAGMKTANHLLYILAGQWAKEQGADEAVILNPDRTVSETNSANLILLTGSQALIPQSAHVLPGVIQARAVEALAGLGWECLQAQVEVEGMLRADAVLLTNSLLGVVGAESVDGRPLDERGAVVEEVNDLVFGFQPSRI